MTGSSPSDIDPNELKRAQDMWASFIKLMKWLVVSSALVLGLLAWIFV